MKTIIYEDQSIIVCNKAPGVPVQSDLTQDKDLQSQLIEYMKVKGYDKPYIGLVHRLDRPVGGCVVFGKNPKSTAHLSAQLKERTIKKTYLAIVEGQPEDQTYTHFIKKKFKGNVSHIVDEKTPKAKKAILHTKHIRSFELDGKKHSLIEINLETGRHHQIRVQLAHIGTPIYGDTKYNPSFMSLKGWHQIALCAAKLTLKHPKTNEEMTFTVDPEYFPE